MNRTLYVRVTDLLAATIPFSSLSLNKTDYVGLPIVPIYRCPNDVSAGYRKLLKGKRDGDVRRFAKGSLPRILSNTNLLLAAVELHFVDIYNPREI